MNITMNKKTVSPLTLVKTDYNDFNEEELKVITSKNEDLNKKINAFLGKNKLV